MRRPLPADTSAATPGAARGDLRRQPGTSTSGDTAFRHTEAAGVYGRGCAPDEKQAAARLIRLYPNELISVSEGFSLAQVDSLAVRERRSTHGMHVAPQIGQRPIAGADMRATERLHSEGQSLWLDNITRKMIDSGQLARYVEQYSVTGLTSNPSIFDKAIASGDYDAEIRDKAARGITGETLFFDLAIEDLQRAADLFLPVWQRTDGVDGWVSLEVSPLLAYDATSTITAAKELHARALRPNVLIKIPGTRQGLIAIEESIAAGVPINVTLLFTVAQYRAA